MLIVYYFSVVSLSLFELYMALLVRKAIALGVIKKTWYNNLIVCSALFNISFTIMLILVH